MNKLLFPSLISALLLVGCGGTTDTPRSETDKILDGYFNSDKNNGGNKDEDTTTEVDTNKIEGVSSLYKTVDYIPLLTENQEISTTIEREYKVKDGKKTDSAVWTKAFFDPALNELVYYATEKTEGSEVALTGGFLVLDNSNKEWKEVSQFFNGRNTFLTPRGTITSKRYTDAKSGYIFDSVKIEVNFQTIPELKSTGMELPVLDAILGTGLYEADNEELDNFFKSNFQDVTINSAYEKTKDTFALVTETLTEPLYLAWLNDDECNKDYGFNDISNMFSCGKLLQTADYSADNQINQLTQLADVTMAEYEIPAIDNGELKNVKILGNEAQEIQIQDSEGVWHVIGEWKEVEQPFKHLTLNLPENTKLAIGDTGLKNGKTIIFEHDNAVYVGQKFERGITTGELMGKSKHVLRMSVDRLHPNYLNTTIDTTVKRAGYYM